MRALPQEALGRQQTLGWGGRGTVARRGGGRRARRHRAVVRRAGAAALRRAPRHRHRDLGTGAPAARGRPTSCSVSTPSTWPSGASSRTSSSPASSSSGPSSPGSSPTACAAAAGSSGRTASALPSSPCSRSSPPCRRSSSASGVTPCRRCSTAIAILAVLWAITSYGVVPLMAWAWQRALAQVPLLFSVLVRALPLLLLFSTFLFINAEVWQVAGTLTGIVYVATLGMFFLLGAVFTLSRIPALMRALNRFDSWTRGRGARRRHTGDGRARARARRGGSGRRPPDDAPAGEHRPRHDLLPGHPDHVRRPRPHRVLRRLRVPGDPGGDGGRVDDARPRRRARPLVRRRARRSSSASRSSGSPPSSARSGRCTSPSCCRPTRRTARSSLTTSPRSCAKLSPCAASTAGRERRAMTQRATSTSGCSTTPTEMRRVMTLFSQVWGSATPPVGVELLRAVQHAGGYVVAAYADEQVIGGSFGFLGRHEANRHCTATSPVSSRACATPASGGR